MSASLPSEELPRRGGREQERTLLVRLAAEIAWPMPLTSLENLQIGRLDNFWQEEPATASGQADGNN